MQGNQGQQNSGSQGSGNKPTLSWSQPAVANKPATPPAAPQQQPPKQNPPKNNPPSNKNEKSSMSSYAGIFVGGLVVGVVIGWGIHSMGSATVATTNSVNQATSTTTTKTTTSTKTTAPVAAGVVMNSSTDLGLTIPSPQAAGLNVEVSRAFVSQPTWVVVYEDRGGLPGNALGAGLFFPTSQGGQTSGTIELLRGTLTGHTYFAGESLDDGDKMFSSQSDKPIRNEKGNPILVEFKTN